MRKGKVLYKGEEAALLTQHNDGTFTFRYTDAWMADQSKPAISLTLPKTKQEYESPYLFPFFYHMLPEGSNKHVVCRSMRIDEQDDFGILLTTARYDTIGAVTVTKILEEK